MLDALRFDNRFVAELPGDALVDEGRATRRQVHGAAYSRVTPTPTAAPRTLAVSREVAEQLGLDPVQCASAEFASVFSGNSLPAGAEPFAMCYGGHQFGNWAGQLGDGRAIALGEVLDGQGVRQTLQLKGPGPTPYSRNADGRAVLRSSIREFLCSEAMFHLGVPTTRALSLVLTGDDVVRDMLYDGHPAPEPGAIVCRVAPSFVRFGNFQLPASRGDVELLRALTDYTIRHDFAHLLSVPDDDRIAAFFAEVCTRTADLVVHWMRVGFVHGVLNTDNMSILGLTIDYGPYGWLEDFDPGWTPNTTDAQMKRYRYGTQPQVVHWNLVQLANALVPLVSDVASLQSSIDTYAEYFSERYEIMMSARLGWGAPRVGDDELIGQLHQLFARTEVDQVLFYRNLAKVPTITDATNATDDSLIHALGDCWYQPEAMAGPLRNDMVGWLRAWASRAMKGGLTDEARREQMNSLNPRFVLRNYLAQEVIDAATGGRYEPISEILEVLRRPYDEQPGQERYAAKRPEWARTKVGCSMLSCSS